MTSALLKLPQSLSRAKKEERVEQILEELVSTCHQYDTYRHPHRAENTIAHCAA